MQQKNEPTIATENSHALLAHYCPDLDEWPSRWSYETRDIQVGQHIVAALTPFLIHLLQSRLSQKTLLRHRDNLWELGGEIIRRLHDEPVLRKKSVDVVLESLLEEDGGPLLYPYTEDNEPIQRSFDATCRKLYAFLQPESESSA